MEELKNFDVLILDDFSHRTYFNPLYFENIRDFVRDGGGLAMTGGRARLRSRRDTAKPPSPRCCP